MKKVVPAFIAGVLFGALVIGAYSYRVKEHELASSWFMQELYKAGTVAKRLRLLDEQRVDVVRRLAQMELEDSIDQSYRLMVAEHPSVLFIVPNLVKGLDDAEEYLIASENEDRLIAWLVDVKEYVANTQLRDQ